MTDGNGKTKRAKPRCETRIDPEKLKELAYNGCTQREMADYFGISQRSMERVCNREPMQSVIASAHGQRKNDIRDKQLEVALSGNPTMLIWLGKQELGQRDMARHELTGAEGRPIEVKHDGADLGADQLAELLEGLASLGAFEVPRGTEANREVAPPTKH